MPERETDILIIGGGPGGMSALIWCHSVGLRGLLLERDAELGGQMRVMYHRVTDYPGLITGTGAELAQKFDAHLHELNLAIHTSSVIREVDLSKRIVTLGDSIVRGRAIILATGARKKRLGVPGEDDLEGSGVSFTATRDHPLFAGLPVVVVGGGDSAFENALMLARVCPSVTLIHRTSSFRARPEWIREVTENPRIAVITDTEIRAIDGTGRPTAVTIENLLTGEQRSIPTQGVFVRLGMTPNTELFSGQVELDEAGYVRVDDAQRTSVNCVYAVGDVCGPLLKSVATAVGQGALAVKAIQMATERS